jgi:hypothetical protein
MKDELNSVTVMPKERLDFLLIANIALDMRVVLYRAFKELFVPPSASLNSEKIFPLVVVYADDVNPLICKEFYR